MLGMKRERNGHMQEYLDTKRSREWSSSDEDCAMHSYQSLPLRAAGSAAPAWATQPIADTTGGSINQQDGAGNTQLHRAVLANNSSLLQILLHHGANANAVNYQGWTPLHVACNLCQPEVARILLKYGARPNWQSNAGQTPLHIAAELLRHARPDSPKWVAAGTLFELLVAHGGNASLVDKYGKAPIDGLEGLEGDMCATLRSSPAFEAHCKRFALLDDPVGFGTPVGFGGVPRGGAPPPHDIMMCS